MTDRLPGFRVIVKMSIHPGMEEGFQRTWHGIGAAVTEHPANLGHWLMRSAIEDDVYYVGSDWVDERRFREFEDSPEHREHRAKLHPYRATGSIEVMHVLSHLPGAGAGAVARTGTT